MDRPEYFELVHSCFSRNEYNGKGRDQLCAPAQSWPLLSLQFIDKSLANYFPSLPKRMI